MAHTHDPNSTHAAGKAEADLSAVTPEQVRAYLINNPALIMDDPDLIASLTAPTRANADNIVDLQNMMIEKLQHRVLQLKDIQADLIEASSFNSLALQSVHDATLAMLRSRSFEELVDYLISPEGMSSALGLQAVTLCIESNNDVAGIGIRGIRLLEQGGVDRIMAGQTYRLSANIEGNRGIYGQQAENIASEALIRLTFSDGAPIGLLAMGAQDSQQFHPEQAGDLLHYIARIIEQCVALWLDLPKES